MALRHEIEKRLRAVYSPPFCQHCPLLRLPQFPFPLRSLPSFNQQRTHCAEASFCEQYCQTSERGKVFLFVPKYLSAENRVDQKLVTGRGANICHKPLKFRISESFAEHLRAPRVVVTEPRQHFAEPQMSPAALSWCPLSRAGCASAALVY